MALFEYLLRQGDSALILAQRVSEWCGHAPALEEDIAMANVGLDLIGQAQMWLGLAGEVEGKGRSADDLAFGRDVREFRNLLLVERPNGNYGQTVARSFLFDAFNHLNLTALACAREQRVAAVAAKAGKEAVYHLDRSRGLLIALGDGTDESRARAQAAIDDLWPYTGEMFTTDTIDDAVIAQGIAPDLDGIRADWLTIVDATLNEAGLNRPTGEFAHHGGKTGLMHSEHLGHLLAAMQWLPRAYPEARW